jgi:alkylation response protein AidB-like acyl-CoA dehydrogenase
MTAIPSVPVQPRAGSDLIAPDCRGLNFYGIDASLRAVVPLYLDGAVWAHIQPHLARLGEIAGGRLTDLAELCDRHPPELHPRDRYGRDEEWVEFHPAYREMERIGFEQFGIHAMTHRPGVLDWPKPFPRLAKYAFQYVFAQAEFGLLCPISVTDTSAYLVAKYASAALQQRYLPGMLSQAPDSLKSAQFMTEKAGGSDVGGVSLRAVQEGDHWRLYGDKWFCSCADADVALLLARPEGAPAGTRGLGLFLMPKTLDDGSRNAYRIVRLKDKLGTRSMASGEIVFNGAIAYTVGDIGRGLKQMLDQVNLSRLSHGVRAAGMMRRCWNESLAVVRHRVAFDRTLIQHPLMRRQLMKLLVPTEEALSMVCFTAETMEAAEAGDAAAAQLLRILTPLLKFRACRDNVQVATGAMEVRGGNGFIEDWGNAKLVRDAHTGLLWEGTSNINGLDVVQRAVRKERAHEALQTALHQRLAQAQSRSPGVPESFVRRLAATVDRAVAFAGHVAERNDEPLARQASTALYHAASAVLMTWEAAQLGARPPTEGLPQEGGDARRLLLAAMLLAHRLTPQDPLGVPDRPWEPTATDLLLHDAPVPLARAAALVAS